MKNNVRDIALGIFALGFAFPVVSITQNIGYFFVIPLLVSAITGIMRTTTIRYFIFGTALVWMAAIITGIVQERPVDSPLLIVLAGVGASMYCAFGFGMGRVVTYLSRGKQDAL